MTMRDPWLESLPEASRAEIRRALRMRDYARGETLFHQGDPAEHLFCLLEGELEVRSISRLGRDQVLTHLHPVRWLGELSFLDGLPRTHSIAATRPSRLGLAPGRVVRMLMARDPGFYRAMVRILCDNSRRLFLRIDDYQKRSVETLVASALLHDLALGGGADRVRMSQQSIAAQIGATRQTVNAHLAALEAEGVVERAYRCVVIRDLDALKRRAAE